MAKKLQISRHFDIKVIDDYKVSVGIKYETVEQLERIARKQTVLSMSLSMMLEFDIKNCKIAVPQEK